MARGVSSKAIKVAAALVVLHFLAAWYVWSTNMSYDQGDLLGLLWWLVAFWILPVFAVLIMLLNIFVRRLTNYPDKGFEE